MTLQVLLTRMPRTLFLLRVYFRTLVLRELVCCQIHKQAPPLEDIADDCSPGMRELIEAALERNPNHRPRAADLLKHDALNPPREDQPRCQSLDSALFERKRLLSRKELELPENIAGTDTILCMIPPSAPLLPFFLCLHQTCDVVHESTWKKNWSDLSEWPLKHHKSFEKFKQEI